MKQHRLRLLLISILTLLLVWVAWPERGGLPDSISEDKNDSANVKKHRIVSPEIVETNRTKSRLRRPGEANSAAEIGMERVERLIDDQFLTDSEVVTNLRLLAQDSALSVKVRSDAMGHGVNLDPSAFADMAADPDLPLDMAEELLTAVINENSNEALQVRAYMGFLNHPFQEIRDEAMSMLAFILKYESDESDPRILLSDLLLKANTRLQELGG